eukprot:GEZU01002097.1.p1 GENE.GEZU01002097.1~~GEZU01002097.1.p1  ORF type:complete len:361 (-),score=54.01 GEZU01002097.1:520-1602(-)
MGCAFSCDGCADEANFSLLKEPEKGIDLDFIASKQQLIKDEVFQIKYRSALLDCAARLIHNQDPRVPDLKSFKEHMLTEKEKAAAYEEANTQSDELVRALFDVQLLESYFYKRFIPLLEHENAKLIQSGVYDPAVRLQRLRQEKEKWTKDDAAYPLKLVVTKQHYLPIIHEDDSDFSKTIRAPGWAEAIQIGPYLIRWDENNIAIPFAYERDKYTLVVDMNESGSIQSSRDLIHGLCQYIVRVNRTRRYHPKASSEKLQQSTDRNFIKMLLINLSIPTALSERGPVSKYVAKAKEGALEQETLTVFNNRGATARVHNASDVDAFFEKINISNTDAQPQNQNLALEWSLLRKAITELVDLR